jgi:uncharacterized protein YacL
VVIFWTTFGLVIGFVLSPILARPYSNGPLLPLAVIIAFGVLGGVVGERRKRTTIELVRSNEGLCGTCGYDLSYSTDACPECGTPIEATK